MNQLIQFPETMPILLQTAMLVLAAVFLLLTLMMRLFFQPLRQTVAPVNCAPDGAVCPCLSVKPCASSGGLWAAVCGESPPKDCLLAVRERLTDWKSTDTD